VAPGAPPGPPALPAAPVVLQAAGVTAGYGSRTILRHLDLSVRAGEIYALLGANGAGKTTTLSLFLGFLAPWFGQVRVLGLNPVADTAQARRQLAYIPENVALYENLSARENLDYFLTLAGHDATREQIAVELERAGLDRAAHETRVAGFSKGMRQKVAIALALARRVPALLLDEPTSGLDPQAIAEFHRLLGVLRDDGVAILMVTHDLLGAAEIADRIGFIDAGRLVEESAASGSERFDVRALYQHFSRKAAS
jgi:ABC-2 type transport system ATP-binding protein